MTQIPEVQAFFDPDTYTISYIVSDPATKQAAIIDSVLDYEPASGRTKTRSADALIEAAASRVESSKKAYSPGVVVGLNYGYVSRRDDAAGRLVPPEDNGKDILGLTGGVSLPLWRSSLEAGVEEGVQSRLAAEEGRREVMASIDGDLGDLVHRIPLLADQLQLYDDLLIIQARQSLQSAESAYAAGTANALDLLDAERVLLQVRIAAERVRSDLDVAYARLEGVIAGSLDYVPKEVDR